MEIVIDDQESNMIDKTVFVIAVVLVAMVVNVVYNINYLKMMPVMYWRKYPNDTLWCMKFLVTDMNNVNAIAMVVWRFKMEENNNLKNTCYI